MKAKNSAVPESIAASKEYRFAKSCSHCTDTCDSKGAYVSTYCHKFNEHLAGFDGLAGFRCTTCPDYARRETGKGARDA